MYEAGLRAVLIAEVFEQTRDRIRRLWKIVPLTFALSFVFSWQVSVLIHLSAVVHEFSHLVTARKLGIRDEGIIFIFLKGGALIRIEDASQKERLRIVIAGPAAGAACALLCLSSYMAFDADVFLWSAFWIASTTLFIMLPINGSDGALVLRTIMESVRLQDEGSLSKSDTVITMLVFVAIAIVLLGISMWTFHKIPQNSFLPLRFFF
jgi:Zn-dependent protease